MRIVAGIVVLLFSCAVARASDATDIGKVLDKQDPFQPGDIYSADVVMIPPSHAGFTQNTATPDELAEALAGPSDIPKAARPKDKKITISAGGKSAWATLTIKVTQGKSAQTWRVSDLLVKTDKGWKIVASAWTSPVPNSVANKDARAGNAAVVNFDGARNDASLAAAFTTLTTNGLDATAAARGDLIAIGSGPGEKTTSGAALAKAWKAGWQGKTTVTSLVTRVSPAGDTGWVAAGVWLQKKDYKIAFMLFCIFEKTKDGAWTLVHAHFSI